LFGKAIINALYYNARTRSGRALCSKLEDYLLTISRNSDLSLIPNTVHKIRVSNVIKIGGVKSQDVYSMLLTYRENGTAQQRNLVLKTYLENIDPVLKMYIHDEDLRRCVREFQVLKSLGRVGFPVPEVYFCESDSSFLGYPFIIMKKGMYLALAYACMNLCQITNLESLKLTRANEL
jgi:hypothetical protein